MSDLTCKQCRDLLPWYARDLLSPEEAAMVQRHLAECADCQAAFAQWQAIASATETAFDMLPVPPDKDMALLPERSHYPLGVALMTDHSPEPDVDGPSRTERTAQPLRRAFPLVAALLAVALVVILAGFGFQYFAKNKPGSPPSTTSSSTTSPAPTDTVEPTATSVPSTATPQPVLPPPATAVPHPTATPSPVTPGNLVATGGAFNSYCDSTGMAIPGEGQFDLTNTGGRTIYWAVVLNDPALTFTPTTGTIAPQSHETLSFSGYSGTYTYTIHWSDHIAPAQDLVIKTSC